MLNCTTRHVAAAAAACLMAMAPLAHAATLEMRVDGGFVTGTLLGLRVGETLSFDTSGSFADGGGALVNLSTDGGTGTAGTSGTSGTAGTAGTTGMTGLTGRLQLSNPVLLNSAATASWKQFAVAGVIGNGVSGAINLSVVSAPGPYRTSRLFANGSLLQSVDVLGAAVTPVPEPSTWALMLAGLAGLAHLKRKARLGQAHQPG